MLNKAKTLKGYRLESRDGVIGTVKEFYFDDRHWTIRYLVADAGDWLADRQVLISTYALKDVIREEKRIAVDMTKKQIEDSPPLESDKPVSVQFEEDYFKYFGWPAYWGGSLTGGDDPDSGSVKKGTGQAQEGQNPHLRSTQHVSGYHVHAEDGEIGHVEDFIIDDETWTIRYLIINTGDWMPGKKVLVSPGWIDRVSFIESKVFTKFTREQIRQAPEYSDESMPNRDYETRLHLHYKRQGYWGDEPDSEVHSG